MALVRLEQRERLGGQLDPDTVEGPTFGLTKTKKARNGPSRAMSTRMASRRRPPVILWDVRLRGELGRCRRVGQAVIGVGTSGHDAAECSTAPGGAHANFHHDIRRYRLSAG